MRMIVNSTDLDILPMSEAEADRVLPLGVARLSSRNPHFGNSLSVYGLLVEEALRRGDVDLIDPCVAAFMYARQCVVQGVVVEIVR